MGEVTYIQTPACRNGRHEECGNAEVVIRMGVCCTCDCHPRGDEDLRPLRTPGR